MSILGPKNWHCGWWRVVVDENDACVMSIKLSWLIGETPPHHPELSHRCHISYSREGGLWPPHPILGDRCDVLVEAAGEMYWYTHRLVIPYSYPSWHHLHHHHCQELGMDKRQLLNCKKFVSSQSKHLKGWRDPCGWVTVLSRKGPWRDPCGEHICLIRDLGD